MAPLSTTYGSSPALLLNTAPASSTGDESTNVSNVVVHPIVLLSVLDHHTRRQEGAGRVIGTLLGRRDGGTVRVFLLVLLLYLPSRAMLCCCLTARWHLSWKWWATEQHFCNGSYKCYWTAMHILLHEQWRTVNISWCRIFLLYFAWC